MRVNNGGVGYAHIPSSSTPKNYWADYEDYFSKWSKSFASSEQKRNFKKKVKDAAFATMTPVDVKITIEPTTFFKRRRLAVNVNEKDLSKYNKTTVVNKIIELYDKVPFNSDIIDDGIIKYLSIWDENIAKYKTEGVAVPDLLASINQYDAGTITYADLRKLFRNLSDAEKKQNIGWQSEGWYKGWGKVWTKVPFADRTLYNKNLRVIQSRVKLRDTVSNEESLRRGKKINRNFINWSSYKPLISKTVESPKKKKIFFILDCSWSMGPWKSPSDPSHQAVSFAAACVNSWVFDCSHVIYHSSSGWENCIKPIKKWELFNLAWGSEGFEYIDDNLNKEWLQGVDYIVALTDLQIGSSAEQGLADYLKKGKRHLIMSFAWKGTLKGMNVRQITKTSDMINAIVTLVS